MPPRLLPRRGHLAWVPAALRGDPSRERARIYRRPPERRPRDEAGRHGALHVECAVADEHALLISSANLTRYALDLNMELGLLVYGGAVPRRVARHFTGLIDAGVLARVAG